MSDQGKLDLFEAAGWQRPLGTNKCSRDPAAGEGTCWYWWEGCPKAEFRGCYQRWYHQQAALTAKAVE